MSHDRLIFAAMDADWQVIYIASRQEKKVSEQMKRMGIVHYLPLSRELRQWSDRKRWVEMPMFRGYLFVQAGKRGEEIIRIQGVVNFLKFNGKPAHVTEKEISIIRKVEASGYYAEQLLSTEDFEPGETVKVVDGPLRGYQGTILRKDNEEFFTLAIESLGQSLKVKVPFELLEK
jgi:transcriptional antiterminator NusG